MRQRLSRFVTLVCALVLTSQSRAQPSPQIPIVVRGERQGHSRQQAESYVNELGIAAGDQQAARWIDSICPHAIGLDGPTAKVVEEQLRSTIAEIGAPLAKNGCAPNLNVVFTDSPEAIVAYVARRNDSVSRDMSPAVVRNLRSGVAPIRWWYNTELRSRDGSPILSIPFVPGVQVESDSGVASLPSGKSGTLALSSPSNVSSQLIRNIQFATVVIDVNRSAGVRLSSAVDYAALVGLAEVKPGATPPRSVLSLFQPNGENRLTNRDRSFLKGLYSIAMDRRARQQRQALISAVAGGKAK